MSATSSGSATLASSTNHTLANSRRAGRPHACTARRVLPTPPTPVSVTSGCAVDELDDPLDVDVATDQRRALRPAGCWSTCRRRDRRERRRQLGVRRPARPARARSRSRSRWVPRSMRSHRARRRLRHAARRRRRTAGSGRRGPTAMIRAARFTVRPRKSSPTRSTSPVWIAHAHREPDRPASPAGRRRPPHGAPRPT